MRAELPERRAAAERIRAAGDHLAGGDPRAVEAVREVAGAFEGGRAGAVVTAARLVRLAGGPARYRAAGFPDAGELWEALKAK